MLSLHFGNPGCLNLSNEPQGWGSGDSHARNKNPEYWEHLKGEGHPRVKDPSRWANAVGENHWTKKADPEKLRRLADHLPVLRGEDSPMRDPKIAKKVTKWRQGKNSEVWLQADAIWELWLKAGRPKQTAKAWVKQTSFTHCSIKTMVASFLNGWIPMEDEEWSSWKASVVP